MSKMCGSSDKRSIQCFELRTYSVQPSKMADFLSLTEQEFHLRTAHSPLSAYWTTEFNGLCQVVHLWPYNSLSDRAQARTKLSQDQEWSEKYVSHILPMLQKIDNIVLIPLPEHSPLILKQSEFFELHMHRMNSPPSEWLPLLKCFLKSRLSHLIDSSSSSSPSATSLAGAFQVRFGPLNSIAFLWQHPTIDICQDLQGSLSKNPDYESLSRHFCESSSKGLVPFLPSLWS